MDNQLAIRFLLFFLLFLLGGGGSCSFVVVGFFFGFVLGGVFFFFFGSQAYYCSLILEPWNIKKLMFLCESVDFSKVAFQNHFVLCSCESKRERIHNGVLINIFCLQKYAFSDTQTMVPCVT